MSAPPRWRLVPEFLLRRAGFPFSTLEAFASPAAAEAAARVWTLRAEAARVREDLLKAHFPHEVRRCADAGDKAGLKILSRWRKRVGMGTAAPTPEGAWSAELNKAHALFIQTVAAEAEAFATLRRQVEEGLLSTRQQLRAFFQQQAPREALFLLSPDLLETMQHVLDRPAGEIANAAERSFERRLYAYAQRLAAKNETTSFFGPLAYGRIEQDAEGSFGPEHPGGVLRKEAFLSFWAAAAIAKAAASIPAVRMALPVRRIPAAGIDERGPRAATGQPVPFSPELTALFNALDDVSDVRALAGKLNLSPEFVENQVRLLEKLAFARRDLEPLSTVSHPLEDVLAQLPAIPEAEPWRVLGAKLLALLRRFEGSRLPERAQVMQEAEKLFTEATGQPARRAAGEIYADRTILYEDCLGDMQPVKMARREADRMEEAISPLLDLGASYGLLRYRANRELAARTLSGLGGKASFLEFTEAMEARLAKKEHEPLLEPAREFLRRFTQLVERAADGNRAVLKPSELEPLIDRKGAGRFASPDVMLATRSGGPPKFVIGEVHPYVFAWGSQNQFSPDFDRLQATFREDLSPWGGAARLATVLRRRRHKGLVSFSFPGAFIEVTGRGTKDPTKRIAVADLRVVEGSEGPELIGPGGPLTLYTGEDDHPHLRAFSIPASEIPPVRLGTHTPRIEVGDFVLQRERWSISDQVRTSVAEAESPEALLVTLAAAQAEARWPRFLFASSPSEGKPMCIDLMSLFSQSLLQRLCAQGPVQVSEMLPGPHELWLHRNQGHHTSELRLAMIRDP